MVKRYIGTIVLGIACFALGAVVQRYYDLIRLPTRQAQETAKSPATEGAGAENTVDLAAIRFDQEPLWAYGFDRPPLPDEKAAPQNPPTRDLRPNEDPISLPPD